MRKKRDQEKRREEKMDAKERSKERKKTVEENRGKVDKKAAAMNLLKARREEKRERGMYVCVCLYVHDDRNYLCLQKSLQFTLNFCVNSVPSTEIFVRKFGS
jgi:hypothetical protein